MKKTESRFWKKVIVKSDKNECWLFEPAIKHNWYGSFYDGEKVEKAHRYSWKIHNKKKIPVGIEVCHSCDVPMCVNPEHLFLGTRKENMHDCKNKNRMSMPPRTTKKGKFIVPVRAVLNPDQVRKIRKLLVKQTIADVARIYNVGESTIRHIKQGSTWKDVK